LRHNVTSPYRAQAVNNADELFSRAAELAACNNGAGKAPALPFSFAKKTCHPCAKTYEIEIFSQSQPPVVGGIRVFAANGEQPVL
jgi:hypothetical protein